MFFSGSMEKWIVEYPYDKMLFSNKKQQNIGKIKSENSYYYVLIKLPKFKDLHKTFWEECVAGNTLMKLAGS